jgi:hypothetical protein
MKVILRDLHQELSKCTEERRRARAAKRKPNIGSIPLFKLLDIKNSLMKDDFNYSSAK